MGTVYLAEDESLGRRVAIKTLPQDFARDLQRLKRFDREARLLASINHPNVATIFAKGEDSGTHYLAMELVEGGTLHDELAQTGSLDLDRALDVARQIARALEATHGKGVTHRDLKPRNVLVDETSNVKVCDFGIAKSGTSPASAGHTGGTTLTGMVLGTAGYMSPEQLRGKPTVDHRADIWAFGCILFECLTGKRAFPGATAVDVMAATLHLEPDWTALPESLPDEARRLLQRCVEKDEDHRLPSIVEARQILDELVADRLRPRPAAVPADDAAETPNNIPVQIARFIGRERQLEEIGDLLTGQALITLVGAGGRGKTRLALETATRSLSRFQDGVWIVELATLQDADLVPQTVAMTLGVRGDRDVEWTEAVRSHLEGTRTLIVLDNCEHVLDASASLAAALLRDLPDLRILCTSRERLGAMGETLYAVPSLGLPPEGAKLEIEELGRIEAIALFVDRARAVRYDFHLDDENAPAVTQICRGLDGIPLAIELAAARVRMLSPQDILERLDKQLQFLVGGTRTGLPHHRTLRALIDWSYDVLEPQEQLLFERLSCFSGGWSLEGAERICADETIEEWEILDVITRLVDRSMVEVDLETGQRSGRARYRLLETMRAYATERWGERGDDRPRVQARHRDFYLELAEHAEPRLNSRDAEVWLQRLEVEHANLRAALAFPPQNEEDAEAQLRLAWSMWMFWYKKGYWTDARTVLQRLLADAKHRPRTHSLARALIRASGIAFLQGEYDEAESLSQQSLEMARELEDADSEARSLEWLGAVEVARGNFDQAAEIMEQSIRIKESLGDEHGLGISFNDLGVVSLKRGDAARARELHERAHRIFERVGDSGGEAVSLSRLGEVALWEGRYDEARRLEEESLALRPELEDESATAKALRKLGAASFHQGDLEAALGFYERGLVIDRKLGNPWNQAVSLTGLGWVLAQRGDTERAREIFHEAARLLADIGNREGMSEVASGMATLELQRGNPERAARLLGAARSLRESANVALSPAARSDVESRQAAVEGALSPVEFTSTFEAGQGLDWDGAVRLILSRTG